MLSQLEELNEYEQTEQRRLANATRMHQTVQRMLTSARDDKAKFSVAVPPGHVSRKDAAAQFYALLVLKKQCVVDVAQAAPYADISITRGPQFDRKF